MVFSKLINGVSMERSVPQFWLIYSPGVFIENVCPILFPAENTEYQLTLLLFLKLSVSLCCPNSYKVQSKIQKPNGLWNAASPVSSPCSLWIN